MHAETFAEWLRRQGHHVVKTRSTYWHDQGPRCYQAFPYHWIIQPAEEETQGFLRSHKALSLRYSTSVAAAAGRLSYHMTYEKPTYGFDDLGRWARKNVRRGLKNCSVEPITFERLAAAGWGFPEGKMGPKERPPGSKELLRRTDHLRTARGRGLGLARGYLGPSEANLQSFAGRLEPA